MTGRGSGAVGFQPRASRDSQDLGGAVCSADAASAVVRLQEAAGAA